jgi:integrase
MAACAGMRRSELLGLRWLNVDPPHGRVLLSQTKNGDSRVVYLNETAKAAVRSLPFDQDTRSTDLLFVGLTGERVSMAFQRACKAAKISDFRFHDLRHTAASWLRMKGVDIHTVAQLLGHKDLRMAARYQHLSPSFLAEAVERLDAAYALNALPTPATA